MESTTHGSDLVGPTFVGSELVSVSPKEHKGLCGEAGTLYDASKIQLRLRSFGDKRIVLGDSRYPI